MLRSRSFIRIFVIALLTILLLSGCGARQDAPMETKGLTASTTAPPPVTYTIRFFVQDNLYALELVDGGDIPKAEPPELPGLHFLQWEPSVVPADGDADYHAVFLPTFEEHVPYMLTENGWFYPDNPFTWQELHYALHTLAGEDSPHLPEIPDIDAPVTIPEMKALLFDLFPDTNAVLDELNVTGSLTRSEAAVLLCKLLGREEETLSVSEGTQGFADISPTREDFSSICEAVIPHDKGDALWQEVSLSPRLTPGWILTDGLGQLVDEDGVFVVDRTVGNFTIDANGFVTSGDAELDKLVRELLKGFYAEHPDYDRFELLRCAYDYTRDSFFYLRKPPIDFGADGWQNEYALVMLTTGRGNCYNYAAVFSMLAKGLGYDAKAVSGSVGSDYAPHSWVMIEMEDGDYLFDPELEMANGPTDYELADLFMRDYSYINSFTYLW